MSMPASSCTFTASSVASRLARCSSSPWARQVGHNLLGSASHSGFGSEPAMVVGNSIVRSPELFVLAACVPCSALCVYGIAHHGARARIVEISVRKPMIDLHYAPTPNGWKITIMLEECGLPYTVVPMQLGRGDQHQPDFLKLSPNGRMPAIV